MSKIENDFSLWSLFQVFSQSFLFSWYFIMISGYGLVYLQGEYKFHLYWLSLDKLLLAITEAGLYFLPLFYIEANLRRRAALCLINGTIVSNILGIIAIVAGIFFDLFGYGFTFADVFLIIFLITTFLMPLIFLCECSFQSYLLNKKLNLSLKKSITIVVSTWFARIGLIFLIGALMTSLRK